MSFFDFVAMTADGGSNFCNSYAITSPQHTMIAVANSPTLSRLPFLAPFVNVNNNMSSNKNAVISVLALSINETNNRDKCCPTYFVDCIASHIRHWSDVNPTKLGLLQERYSSKGDLI